MAKAVGRVFNSLDACADATKVVMVKQPGSDGEGKAIEVPDHDTRRKAARDLFEVLGIAASRAGGGSPTVPVQINIGFEEFADTEAGEKAINIKGKKRH